MQIKRSQEMTVIDLTETVAVTVEIDLIIEITGIIGIIEIIETEVQ